MEEITRGGVRLGGHGHDLVGVAAIVHRTNLISGVNVFESLPVIARLSAIQHLLGPEGPYDDPTQLAHLALARAYRRQCSK
jgi:hypothetical protein